MKKSDYRTNEMITENSIHEENFDGEGMGALINDDGSVLVYSPYGIENFNLSEKTKMFDNMRYIHDISAHLIVTFSSLIR